LQTALFTAEEMLFIDAVFFIKENILLQNERAEGNTSGFLVQCLLFLRAVKEIWN